MSIASKAASEKLRTEVIEITVDAKQRLNAFKSDAVVAVSSAVRPDSNKDIKTGIDEVIAAVTESMT